MTRALALLTLLALEPGTVFAQDLDRRVPARPGGLLQVDLDMGEDFQADRLSLDVRAHEADEVWAVADLSGLGGSSVSFRLEEDDDGVRLYGRSGGIIAWLFGGPGVSVRIWVPRDFSLDLRCSAGSVRVEDVNGRVRARVGEGSIDVRGVAGDVSLTIGSGPVGVDEIQGNVVVRAERGELAMEWVTGDIEARTGDGDIRLRHMDGRVSVRSDDGQIDASELRGPTEARTERGAVHARFVGPPAGVLESYGGSIHVTLPEDAGTDLDARTRSGTVEFGPGVRAEKIGKRSHYRGRVNGGGDRLRLFTDRGSIRVDRK